MPSSKSSQITSLEESLGGQFFHLSRAKIIFELSILHIFVQLVNSVSGLTASALTLQWSLIFSGAVSVFLIDVLYFTWEILTSHAEGLLLKVVCIVIKDLDSKASWVLVPAMLILGDLGLFCSPDRLFICWGQRVHTMSVLNGFNHSTQSCQVFDKSMSDYPLSEELMFFLPVAAPDP
jgi:hypothetical protein